MYASNVLGFIENPDLVRRLLLSEGDAVDVCKILGLGGEQSTRFVVKNLLSPLSFADVKTRTTTPQFDQELLGLLLRAVVAGWFINAGSGRTQ